MSIVQEAKESVKQKQKEAKAMKNQPIKETIKTIVITSLVTAIIAFIGGVLYQKSVSNEVREQAKELSAVTVQTPSKQ